MPQDRKRNIRQSLGELESEVMSAIWNLGQATVQDVKDALELTRPLAYTTVMTVMTRLTEKGLLLRQKEGRAYLYSPKLSQEKLAGSLLTNLVRRLYDGEAEKAIAYLLDNEEAVDEDELERLEKLIQEKRKKSKK